MIRAVLWVGWIGLALYGWTGALGYGVRAEEDTHRHMSLGLFAAAALLLSNLCVWTYLLATRRLVRRTVAELGLDPRWSRERDRVARRGWWGALAALPLIATFLSGFPTFSGAWPAVYHHGLAWAATALQLTFLLVAGAGLRDGERHLVAFGEEVEAVRYTPPPAGAPDAPTSAAKENP